VRERKKIQGLLRQVRNDQGSSGNLPAIRHCHFKGTGQKSLAAVAPRCHQLAIAMRKALAMLSLRGRVSRRIWALFALALFLTLQAVAASEPLHKLIHSNADSADHHCAVTSFLQGQVNSAETDSPLIVFVAALFFLLPPLQSAVFSSFDYRYSASRAPPRR
jgi:hypothetical protein